MTILGKLRFLGLTHWITSKHFGTQVLQHSKYHLQHRNPAGLKFFSQAKITLVQIESCQSNMLWLSQTAHESPASHGCILTNPLRISHRQMLSASHIAPFVNNAPNDMIAKGWNSSCTTRAKHKLNSFNFFILYGHPPTPILAFF